MNVLLIDDDDDLRCTTRIALEAMSHLVTEAKNGETALEVLGRRPFQFALLDLHLGKEEGLVLLPKLLALAPGLQVMIITAYATIETAVGPCGAVRPITCRNRSRRANSAWSWNA
jgi:DNA-binding NtrC family response regulator